MSLEAFVARLADELGLAAKSIYAVLKLLEEGNTVPFIARYRKEATNNLDEVQIRKIQERYQYLVELEDRRKTILESIESQGKLTDELRKKLLACDTKSALEDLYLPYKPKRRTRATIAMEKGLAPLADQIQAQPLTGSPTEAAQAFVDAEKGVADVEEALKGARDILAERLSEHADIRRMIREAFASHGVVVSKGVEDKQGEPSKFEQYYDFKEAVKTIPSHRYLAIRRGEREGFLSFEIELDDPQALERCKKMMGVNRGSPFAAELDKAVEDGYKRLLLPSVETDVRVDLKMRSDTAAVEVFADNLSHLLMASPLGTKNVVGIDPGLRTGCKCVAVDATGKFLDTVTIYLTGSASRLLLAKEELLGFIGRYKPAAIAVGNGTGGRETEAFVRKLLKDADVQGIILLQVNEAGASVYSASDVAREEFPDLDLTIRGAISIARRLQDPLAELVKIDPKSIGVGQYQHDVHQPLLSDKLNQVVESCVNRVGVEINTASAPLLSYVAGIGATVAKRIVSYRDEKGLFSSRQELLKVPGLGPKTFEQAAGFLRIRGGKHPLDSSAVHPERYSLVERMAKDQGLDLSQLVGNATLAQKLDITRYRDESVGEYTLKDIVDELCKPGRDPRDKFEPPAFREDVQTLEDLEVGMVLEGVVTNVTAFGAFVDVGVHQDGLVHVSELSDRFIKDPSEVVKAGDKLKVKVMSVDIPRKRISLSARAESKGKAKGATQPPPKKDQGRFSHNPFANL